MSPSSVTHSVAPSTRPFMRPSRVARYTLCAAPPTLYDEYTELAGAPLMVALTGAFTHALPACVWGGMHAWMARTRRAKG